MLGCCDPVCAHQYACWVLLSHQSTTRVAASPNPLIHSRDMWPLVISSSHPSPRIALFEPWTQRCSELWIWAEGRQAEAVEEGDPFPNIPEHCHCNEVTWSSPPRAELTKEPGRRLDQTWTYSDVIFKLCGQLLKLAKQTEQMLAYEWWIKFFLIKFFSSAIFKFSFLKYCRPAQQQNCRQGRQVSYTGACSMWTPGNIFIKLFILHAVLCNSWIAMNI